MAGATSWSTGGLQGYDIGVTWFLNQVVKLVAFHQPRCDQQNDLLLFVDGCVNLAPVDDQKCFQCRVSNAFVAVDEGMILYEARIPEPTPFRQLSGKVFAAKGGSR